MRGDALAESCEALLLVLHAEPDALLECLEELHRADSQVEESVPLAHGRDNAEAQEERLGILHHLLRTQRKSNLLVRCIPVAAEQAAEDPTDLFFGEPERPRRQPLRERIAG